MHKLIQLFFGVGLVTSCGLSDAGNTGDAEPKSDMEKFMVSGLSNTPFAALIRNKDVQKVEIPDADPSDDSVEEQWLFTADVIEAYRGGAVGSIRYTVEGEEPNFGDAPFIILLCGSNENYYWPGVGFNFPAGEREKSVARAAVSKLDPGQKEFSECEN